MQADIELFAYENELTTDLVSHILHSYFIDTKSVTEESLRQELVGFGIKGLLRITALIDKIREFLVDSYNKFTAEGE